MLLITGGLGFIGSNFVNLYISGELPMHTTEKITILDNATYASNRENISPEYFNRGFEVVIGDISDPQIVKNSVEKCSGIIHFAAESHVDRSINNPGIFVQTNIVGTWNLIHWANYFGKTLLNVSTDEVYGSSENGYFSETDSLMPSSPYSASKAAGDLLAKSYYETYKSKVIITRCTNNYGKYQNQEKLIPKIITNAIKNIAIPIYGNGGNIRNWISVEDHCFGIAQAFMYGNYGEIYNFGSKEYFSNLELAKLILEMMGKPLSLIKFVPDRLGHDFRYSVNYDKSLKNLNWNPKFNLLDKLPEIIEYYKIRIES